MDKKVLAILSPSSYSEIPRFRQQLARQLSNYRQVLYIVYPQFCYPQSLSYVKSDGRIDIIDATTEKCNSFISGSSQYLSWQCDNYFSRLALLLSDYLFLHGLRLEKLFTFFPNSSALSNFFNIIYVCNDNFPLYSHLGFRKSLLGDLERQTVLRASLIIAVGDVLQAKLKKWSDHVYSLLPGHEFDPVTFMSYDAYLEYSRAYHSRHQPFATFMGNIDARLDFLCLRTLIDSGFQLHLIGNIATDLSLHFSQAQLKAIHIINPLTGDELLVFLRSSNLLLIPYKTHLKMMQAVQLNNKFFQYLATGLPILATKLPGYVRLGPPLVYAVDPNEFSSVAHNLSVLPSRVDYNQRLSFASENTWTLRGQELAKMLKIDAN